MGEVLAVAAQFAGTAMFCRKSPGHYHTGWDISCYYIEIEVMHLTENKFEGNQIMSPYFNLIFLF
jgi:hypothetical protein